MEPAYVFALAPYSKHERQVRSGEDRPRDLKSATTDSLGSETR